MIRLQTLLPVDGVVATGAVRAAYPDLNKQKTKRWMKPGVILFTGILVFIVNLILKNKVKLIDQRATQYSKLTSPRCESPSGPLVSGLTMMTLTPGRILEENIWREISFRDYTTTSVSSLRLWSECASSCSLFSQQSILTVPDSMSGRLCGAPRSTSLTLREMDKRRLVNHSVRSDHVIIRLQELSVYLSWRRDFMST